MWRAGLVVASTMLISAALAGCSDDDDEGSSSSADVVAAASEWQFDPNDWTVSEGEFSVEFTNDGTIDHEWAVLTQDGKIESEADFKSEDQVLFEIEGTPAGETVTETFTIDEPGTYQVACLIEGHFDNGMEGELTVE